MNPADKIFSYLSAKQYRRGTEDELFDLFFTTSPRHKSFRHNILKNVLSNDGRFSFDPSEDMWSARESMLAINIHEAQYCVIDVETTGFNNLFDRITEIAIIKMHKGETISHIESLVNPNRSVPVKLQRLTGIYEHMLVNKPSFSELAPIIRSFVKDTIIVAHHSSFDVRFINSELQRCGNDPLSNITMCTCALAKRLLPALHSYSLDTLAEYFGLKFVSRHRAYGDSLMALLIFKKFLDQLNSRSITTIQDLIAFLSS
ncbi:MAG: 3'-5' exonuclease [Candidatus Auribacterota bacterium]|jgi:DNA polymerase III epsilon subunit family exonuclease|nr:3'-5' exonuclease [Candidatus Auribacterota bacterium]